MFRISGEAPFGAYYNLGIEEDGVTIAIDVPNAVWEQFITLIRSDQYRDHIQKWFRTGSFIFPSALPWGYGPIFLNDQSPTTGWQRIRCELPCFVDVDGQMLEGSWARGREIIASIWFIITCLEKVRDDNLTYTFPYQSLEFVVSGTYDDHSYRYAICAGLSNKCCDWIVSHENTPQIDEITRCMQNAYCRIYGPATMDPYKAHNCCAKIRAGCSLSFDAPGDRCGIGTYTNYRGKFGIDMHDHNVDNSMQVLILLVGLAKFNQLVVEQSS